MPARAAYLASLRRAAASAEPLPRDGTAIVFAPHPDDETLACGATVAERSAAQLRVCVVVMTDGAASADHGVSPSRLKEVRTAEALAATSALGLASNDVVFLEYPDQQLAAYQRDAVIRVRRILAAVRPRLVFVPYRLDVHPDHEATSAIVHAALESVAGTTTVYEYPVWYLHHWPLVDEPPLGRVPVLSTLRWGALRAMRVHREFRCGGDVRPFLNRKHAAFACYRSQATQLSSGFVSLFFNGYELFRRVDVRPRRTGA